MTGMAALVFCGVFTSCSHDTDLGGNNPQLSVQETYEEAFITRFGTPVATQDWGFGDSRASTRSGNMTGKERVAETSTGINANANEWADAADAPHGHGGWIVPAPLTEEQKSIVAQYFQTHDSLDYQDPHFANFFVQQVYKGDSIVKHGDTTEGIVAANGTSKYASGNMNLLTVGYNEQHINNFNGGDASYVNVLDSGYTVNQFDQNQHPDQIMLMVNIDDTGCMGYHCSATGVSRQVNNKAALVGWQTIRTWANSIGLNGNCLNDGWNRSFVGFDLALKPLDESLVKNNGEPVYAMFNQVPAYNDFQYATLDEESVMKIGEAPEGQTNDGVLTSNFNPWDNGAGTVTHNADGSLTYSANQYGGISYWIGSKDWSSYEKLVVEFESAPAGGKVCIETNNKGNIEKEFGANASSVELDLTGKDVDVKQVWIQASATETYEISSIHLVGEAPQVVYFNSDYLIGDDTLIPFIDSNTNQYAGETRTVGESDWTIEVDGKTCINLKFFKDLYDEGWYPVYNSALRTWAKWTDSDGYFSDWIVTLSEAQRQDADDDDDDDDEYEEIRVIAEDLSIDQKTDFDFNDVVFDVRRYTSGAKSGRAEIILQAAGGTLPLYVDGHEVHAAFGLTDTKTMVNTKANFLGYNGIDNLPAVTIPITNNTSKTIRELARDIRVYVIKKVDKVETECDLTAPLGDVASKIAVGTDFDWCNERQDIDNKYSLKDGTSLFKEYVQGLRGEKWYLEFEEK